MKFATRIASAAALLLACMPAQAEAPNGANAPSGDQQVKVQIGSALVCDTQQQVERFVALYEGNVQSALTAVNGEQIKTDGKTSAAQACDVATIAYVLGPEVSQARSTHGNGTFKVVRVLVLGVLTEQGLRASEPTPLYSVAKIEDVEA